jgi:hypothetical protein
MPARSACGYGTCLRERGQRSAGYQLLVPSKGPDHATTAQNPCRCDRHDGRVGRLVRAIIYAGHNTCQRSIRSSKQSSRKHAVDPAGQSVQEPAGKRARGLRAEGCRRRHGLDGCVSPGGPGRPGLNRISGRALIPIPLFLDVPAGLKGRAQRSLMPLPLEEIRLLADAADYVCPAVRQVPDVDASAQRARPTGPPLATARSSKSPTTVVRECDVAFPCRCQFFYGVLADATSNPAGASFAEWTGGLLARFIKRSRTA